ncbi:hypothetical protein [Haloarcula amylovorans]|uniref:hypothetical protein n=1 Tax=Haloarcula amylovorans TaxID=2562280 RepID=UPI001075F56C|nr:hypothetical protein [Halomicroarcula amylolytica]
MPKRLLKAPKFVWRQVSQIASGLRSLFSWSLVKGIVPDWILKITVEAIPKALYGDDPQDQIEGSIILIGWSIATSLFTGGITLAFVLFWGVFLTIGVLRFSDAGSGAWDKTTSLFSPSLPGRGGDGSYGRRRGR